MRNKVTAKKIYRYWCPNGCGRSVYHYGSSWTGAKPYLCKRCNKTFDKEELI